MNNLLTFKSDDAGKLILRVILALVVFFHGYSKLIHGVSWISGMLGEIGIPGFIAYGTYMAEVVAPILLVLGYYSRLAAATIVIDMLVAIFLVLRNQIFAVKEMGGGWGIELEALILFAAASVWLFGSGKYAVSKGQGTWD
jgi:putative oxidoreductase